MPTCVAFGCKNRSSTKGITFHKFPEETDRRILWVNAVQREEWTPSKWSRLCSQHFCEEDLDRTSVSCVRIRENAIPCIFPSLSSCSRKKMLNEIEKEDEGCFDFGAISTHHIDIKEEISLPLDSESIKNESQEMVDENKEEYYNTDVDAKDEENISMDFSETFKNDIKVEEEDIDDVISQVEVCMEQDDIKKETIINSESNECNLLLSYDKDATPRDLQSNCNSEKLLQQTYVLSEHSVQCTVCNKICVNKCKLNIHMRMHTGERPYACSTCNKAYRQKCHLKHHLETHTESEKYNCFTCKKPFFQKSNLYRHMKLHLKQNDFHCDVCGKKFCHKISLKNHIVTHSNGCQYVCDVCNKSFVWKSSLKKHKEIHSEKKPFNCALCDKSFFHKSNFTKHVTVHDDSRPFDCEVCKKSFYRKDSLKNHMVIHSGESPYICNVCNKTFARKYRLDIHVQRHLNDIV